MPGQKHAAAAAGFFGFAGVGAGHAANQPLVDLFQTALQLVGADLQHVVDVFALLPIEHVHHPRGNIGGGERIVELESGGHAGALAGFVVHFVGVVERDNGFFAAQKRPIDGADIGHAAYGEAGKAWVVCHRGFN